LDAISPDHGLRVLKGPHLCPFQQMKPLAFLFHETAGRDVRRQKKRCEKKYFGI
jgi:hypothetical protein